MGKALMFLLVVCGLHGQILSSIVTTPPGPSGGGGGIALVTSGAFTSINTGSSTSTSCNGGACNTTGANLYLIGISALAGSGSTPLITDSGSNTYTCATAAGVSSLYSRICWVYGPATSSSFTWTVNGSGLYCTVVIFAFSGTTGSTIDQFNSGVNSGAGAALSAGSVTPSHANEIVFTSVATSTYPTGASYAVSGFTVSQQIGYTVNNFAGGGAYQIQTSATAVNPNWTWTGSAVQSAASVGTFQ